MFGRDGFSNNALCKRKDFVLSVVLRPAKDVSVKGTLIGDDSCDELSNVSDISESRLDVSGPVYRPT